MAQEKIEEAKEELEEAEKKLECAIEEKRDEDISEATASANIAKIESGIAVEVAAAANEKIEEIKNDLENHEEADQWLKTQMEKIDSRISTLELAIESLLIRLPLPQEPQPAPENQEIPETVTITPETPMEPSSETKTEAQEKSEEERQEAEVIIKRKVRLI